MKRLILMRHAKSDWSAGAGSDFDRPLNPRGRRAAEALGGWLRSKGLVPDQVLCSAAMRTKETLVRLDLPGDVEVRFLRQLYLAEAMVILDRVQQATGDCVLVIGHNPGIGVAAAEIVKEMPDHPDFQRYPTGATLVADFEIGGWDQADCAKANARHFIVPRALTD